MLGTESLYSFNPSEAKENNIMIILLLFSVLTRTCLSFFDISDLITNGSFNREEIVKEAKRLGPRIAGKMLRDLVSEDCTIPGESKLGSGSLFDLSELISQAMHKKVQVGILDFDVVCLNQGYHKHGHSSASVIAKYFVRYPNASITRSVTKQFPLVCYRGTWITPFPDSEDVIGTLDTPTRRDCQMCPSTGMFISTTDAEHCLGEPMCYN